MTAATQKQFDLIKSLLAERAIDEVFQARIAEARKNAVAGMLTARAASLLIDALFAAPKATTPAAAEPEAGIYDLDGKMLVRVYHGQQSGHMLVKSVEIADDGSVTYEYQGAASKIFRSIASPRRLPIEEVGSLGIASGQCLICGRALDDPESVDRGIGPVCASKY